MKISKLERIDYIDVYKFIGITLMIMGHIGFGNTFDFFIHAFHMPMFFFISGYLYKNNNSSFKTYFKNKFRSLLVPYFIIGTIHLIIYVLFKENLLVPLESFLWTNTENFPIAGALWFLTCLFFVDIMYFIINKMIKNEYIKLLIIVLFGILGCTFYKYTRILLPFAITQSFVGLSLYYIGNKVREFSNKKIINKILNLNIIMILILSVICYILIFKNGYINIRTQNYSNIFLFYINSIMCSILIINYSKYIVRLLKNTIILKVLKNIGKESIIYVCLNQICIMSILKIINRILPNNIISNNSFIGIIILIATILILYIISLIINKTKMQFIFGKKMDKS